MKAAILAFLAACLAASPVASASISRSYSYFSVGGNTLAEVEKQLLAQGPHVHSTGKRHAGATRMEFVSQVQYGDGKNRCRIVKAQVTVKANVILPRWRNRRHAEPDTALIWDTLSRDIKRHEESHLVIARNHARDLENALERLRPRSSCDALQAEVGATTERILAAHDREQERFDAIENRNFESRFMRLLSNRMEQPSRPRQFQHR